MPRLPIDYAKTIIYKIVCNDLSITECYVGHTTDFVRRKHNHKNRCANEKDKKYNLKIYKIIRENGGWENFTMVVIELFPCNNSIEACKREQELYEELDCKMNTNFPQRNKKEYRDIHKEKMSEYFKEYYIANREQIISKNHIYADSHKDEINKGNKLYRELHKEQIKEKRSKKIVCDCGKEINYDHKARHLKTKEHNDLMLCKDVVL
jgi:hypothetical protein